MRWLVALLLSATPAFSTPYEITRVIDGDTVEIAVDFLPSPLPPKLSIRVMGIDTPEKAPRAQCEVSPKVSSPLGWPGTTKVMPSNLGANRRT